MILKLYIIYVLRLHVRALIMKLEPVGDLRRDAIHLVSKNDQNAGLELHPLPRDR